MATNLNFLQYTYRFRINHKTLYSQTFPGPHFGSWTSWKKFEGSRGWYFTVQVRGVCHYYDITKPPWPSQRYHQKNPTGWYAPFAEAGDLLDIQIPSYQYRNSHLTHWGRVTHIYVNKLTIIGSDNGLSPSRRQAIIWTNAGILLIRPLGANFSEILIEILTFSFKKMQFKVSSAKWRPFCLGLNGLNKTAAIFFIEFSISGATCPVKWCAQRHYKHRFLNEFHCKPWCK